MDLHQFLLTVYLLRFVVYNVLNRPTIDALPATNMSSINSLLVPRVIRSIETLPTDSVLVAQQSLVARKPVLAVFDSLIQLQACASTETKLSLLKLGLKKLNIL